MSRSHSGQDQRDSQVSQTTGGAESTDRSGDGQGKESERTGQGSLLFVCLSVYLNKHALYGCCSFVCLSGLVWK